MDYTTLKAFLLNFYTRYLASWALKALATFLATHGVAAESSGAQAQAIIEGLLAMIVFAADFWHSRATTAANINAMPPAAITSIVVNPDSTVTTTAVQTTPAKP